ncbi:MULTISPECIES: ABC transporter permease [unclassified Paenibacillus]|uniref:ABC transporter permease n=1 Tax=unclassified Paenibacillus TaxID=185978 RepID=UPI00088EB6E6|nr:MULTISPECIES: ABC transporter permease [unclassified Paenibacillus]SDL99747.1 peptide/nickel transport system permease protein [Paenibacillus sp. OK060]SHN83422.1 peptide/nickel transport system permease protein [Paenibacillus sp. ov031]
MSMKPLVGDEKGWTARTGRLRLWSRRPLRQRVSFTVSRLFFYAALLVVVFTVTCAIVPGWIAPYDPTQMMTDAILQAPSAAHLFGTDYFGRDIFSVVVHGSRDSLLIGFASVLVGGLVGSALGIIAGYAGGVLDTITMRAVDILMAVPGVLLALSVAAALGPGLLNIALAVAVSSIPGYARVMRGQVMSVKGLPFITATRSLGGSNARIFWKHVLPHSLSPLLVMATLGVGTSILTGSGLSFLGLGVLKEIPDWGALLSQGRGYLTVAWWICTFPGLAITMFVLAVNLIGDDIRDRLDPKVNGAA